jgi:hypothetical protein
LWSYRSRTLGRKIDSSAEPYKEPLSSVGSTVYGRREELSDFTIGRLPRNKFCRRPP